MAAIRVVQRRRQEEKGGVSVMLHDDASLTARTIRKKDLMISRLDYILTKDSRDLEEIEEKTFELHEARLDATIPGRKIIRETYQREDVQIAIAVVILLNYITEIAQAQDRPAEGSSSYKTYEGFEYFFTIFFAAELAINMYGSWFIRFFVISSPKEHFGWNLFDFVIVIISIVALGFPELPGITVLRLFRAFRVARLFKKIKSLNHISNGILLSIPGVIQVFIFLIILMGIWSIMGVSIFRDTLSDAQNPDMPHLDVAFENWAWGMYTMFKALMGDFLGLHDELLYDHDLALTSTIFFVSYAFFATILLMNVVVAVLLDKYLNYTEMSNQIDEEEDLLAHDHIRNHKPTFYIKKAGVFHHIRSVEWHEVDHYKQQIIDVTPTNSDEEDESDTFTQEDINDWKVSKVCRWLQEAGYDEFREKFQEAKIDGTELANLSITQLPALGMGWGIQNTFHDKIQGVLCRQARFQERERIIRDVFHKYDKNGDGVLGKDEFVEAWMEVLPEAEEIFNRDVVETIFQRLDFNGDGEIDLEEFKEAKKMFEDEGRKQSNADIVNVLGSTMHHGMDPETLKLVKWASLGKKDKHKRSPSQKQLGLNTSTYSESHISVLYPEQPYYNADRPMTPSFTQNIQAYLPIKLRSRSNTGSTVKSSEPPVIQDAHLPTPRNMDKSFRRVSLSKEDDEMPPPRVNRSNNNSPTISPQIEVPSLNGKSQSDMLIEQIQSGASAITHLQLGDLLQKEGDLQGAKKHYEIAANAGIADARQKLDALLQKEKQSETKVTKRDNGDVNKRHQAKRGISAPLGKTRVPEQTKARKSEPPLEQTKSRTPKPPLKQTKSRPSEPPLDQTKLELPFELMMKQNAEFQMMQAQQMAQFQENQALQNERFQKNMLRLLNSAKAAQGMNSMSIE